eukprot:368957_1
MATYLLQSLDFNKNPIVQLYPYKYDSKLEKWVLKDTDFGIDISADLPESDNEDQNDNDNKDNVETKEEEKQDKKNKKKEAEEIIVMSFNVWFGDYKFNERQQKLVEIMKEIQPDIFCFQEVTKGWIDNIVKIPFIQNNYGITDVSYDLKTIIPYGVFTGVNIHKFDILDVKICQLYSFMSRKLLCTKIKNKNNDDIFWINTVHLESKYNTDIRIEQLKTIFNKYMIEMKQLNDKQMNTVMLMGDFNFRDNTDNKYLNLESEFKENDYLKDDQFIDCWKQYANDNDIQIKNGWTRRVGYRYDRILMNVAAKWNVSNFKILGDAENMMPSDHKGVVVYLK